MNKIHCTRNLTPDQLTQMKIAAKKLEKFIDEPEFFTLRDAGHTFVKEWASLYLFPGIVPKYNEFSKDNEVQLDIFISYNEAYVDYTALVVLDKQGVPLIQSDFTLSLNQMLKSHGVRFIEDTGFDICFGPGPYSDVSFLDNLDELDTLNI